MNEYYGENDWRDYLAHHGILGMKWGKRNGPPYPLGASDHSASEKKAGWRKSLGKSSEYQPKNDYEKKRLDTFKKDVERARNAETDEEHDRLDRIADTRNQMELKSSTFGNNKVTWYELKSKNGEYMSDNNDDDTIETIHKIDDDYKTAESICRKAAEEYMRDSDGFEGAKLKDAPLVYVYKKRPIFIFGIDSDLYDGDFDVDYDLDKKKVWDVGYND